MGAARGEINGAAESDCVGAFEEDSLTVIFRLDIVTDRKRPTQRAERGLVGAGIDGQRTHINQAGAESVVVREVHFAGLEHERAGETAVVA